MPSLWLSTPSMALCPFMALYSSFSSLRLFVLSTALCPLFNPPSSLQPSVPLNSHMFPLQLSVHSATLYPLYGPLFPQQLSVPSMALCPLYSSIFSTALSPFHGPLSPLTPSYISVPSMTLSPMKYLFTKNFFNTSSKDLFAYNIPLTG
jgi:hypothetical protein